MYIETFASEFALIWSSGVYVPRIAPKRPGWIASVCQSLVRARSERSRSVGYRLKKWSFVIFIFLMLAFSLAMSLAVAEAQSRSIHLVGEVRDSNGDLIVGARMSLKSHSGFERE